MFSEEALQGFITSLTVDVSKMNAVAASAAIADLAARERYRVLAQQGARSGMAPNYRQIVDNIEGAALESVKPDGYVMFAWTYLAEVVRDTYHALVLAAPKLSGTYVNSIIITVDDVEVAVDDIDEGVTKAVIVATAPYSRKLEVGWKAHGRVLVQAGHHYVEETAIVARRLSGAVADIQFGYQDIADPWILKDRRGHRRVRGAIVDYVRYPAIFISARTA